MKHPSGLVVKSFAKLNLYLGILNKRKDNFHNLNTLFCRINLADTLIFKKRKDKLIKVHCRHPDVPGDETNLCWRAAELLRGELKLKRDSLFSAKQSQALDSGIDIQIQKRIPVGAGLGGGSSNAASVLLGLNKYWGLNLPRVKLARIGAKIGSDVPFFIYNTRFALGSQRGDKIRPLISLGKLDLWFILIYPGIKVSTPMIYRRFDVLPKGGAFSGLTRRQSDVKIFVSELRRKGRVFDAQCLRNDLEIVTASLYPVVNQVKKAVSDIGLEKIMMSGSGPAVFALCSGCKQARDLSVKLRKKYKSWRVFAVSAV